MIGKHARDLVDYEPYTRKQKSDRKRVTFAAMMTISYTLPRQEYSVEEKAAAWYNHADFCSFKHERFEIAKMMILRIPCDNICTRGLENLTAQGARERASNISKGIQAVLDEQELQIYDGKDNREMLAHIYKMSTKKSITSALKRGQEYSNDNA